MYLYIDVAADKSMDRLIDKSSRLITDNNNIDNRKQW